MKTLKTLALATAVSAGLLGSVGALAATDGLLGTSSSNGNFDIFLIKEAGTKIWGLKDLDLNGDEGIASIPRATYDFCVFANASTGTAEAYKMTVKSANGNSAADGFRLINSAGALIDYNLTVTDGTTTISDPDTETTLTAGAVPNQPNPNLLTCDNNANATLEVWFPADQSGLSSGIYTDNIEITVSVL